MHRKVSLSRAPWLVKLLPLLLILGACATGAIREKQLTLPVIDGATSVGQETCVECHEGVKAGVHSRLADFEYMGGTQGCEACHGGGSLHVDSDGDQILKFGDLLPEESAAICAKCHTDGNLMEFAEVATGYGVNALFPCEVKAGNDLFALRRQFPDLVLFGWLEKEAVNEGNEQTIEGEIMSKAPRLLKSGRYFPNGDHGIQPFVTYQSLCRFMTVLHEVCGNPEGEFPRV